MGIWSKQLKLFIRLLTAGMLAHIVASCALTTPSSTVIIQPTAATPALPQATIPLLPTATETAAPTTFETSSATASPVPPSPTPKPRVPVFDHIVVIVFENKDYRHVIGAASMPILNRLAEENSLLSAYYAPAHPSLPNYLALIGGDTFGVNRNCEDCYRDAPNLADLIEESGREWKTYQESMPAACFRGSKDGYAQKHNPFMYFDTIRLDKARCEQRVVPLEQLDNDLAAGQLPDFVFITPNLCNSMHDCGRDVADAWLGALMDKLRGSTALSQNSLIVITFDEASGDDNSGCCGLPEPAGGRIATVLVSPLARQGFEDDTPYTHYSLLKTIAEAWGLPELGHAADPQTALIEAPWK